MLTAEDLRKMVSPGRKSLAEQDKENGRSHFRGHPIIYVNNQWLYEDTRS